MSGPEKLSPTPVAKTFSAKSKNTIPTTTSQADMPLENEPLFERRNWFSIGILESVAIHRFRNLFMSMMGNISFIREELKNGQTPEKYLNDLDRSLNEASQYSNWLQLYADKPKSQLSSIDLNQLVREAIDIISKTNFSSLKISFTSCENVRSVSIDPFLVKLCIWELISEYQRCANEKMSSPPNGNRSPSLTIEVKEVSTEAIHANRQQAGRECVSLNFKSSELNITTQAPSTKSFCTSPAIEISKFIVRLFQGEISYKTAADHEHITLSFPIQPERS